MSRALNDRNSEARLSEFHADLAEKEVARLRAEVDANPFSVEEWAEREVARMKSECAANSRRAKELSDQRVRRARRAGKREVAEEVRVRRERFATYYSNVEDAQRANGDYLECRGVFNGLFLTQCEDYSYAREFPEPMERLVGKKDMQPELFELRARVWEQWNPIVVSPDSVEVGTEIPDASGCEWRG